MGTRGPVPRRKETLRGHRGKDELSSVTYSAGAREVQIPPESKEWHPIARRLWRSLKVSGQARFYEPSDWAVAYSLMDDLTYYKNGAKRSGQMLATIMSGLNDLLVTEGDRRRVGIELQRATSEELESAGVEEMEKWRQRLGG